MPLKVQWFFLKNGKFDLKKALKATKKWSGLKNLDLAKKLQPKKVMFGKIFKTWKKNQVL